jgi:hypothetical protein
MSGFLCPPSGLFLTKRAQYIAQTGNTIPFDEAAPVSVVMARELIRNRARNSLGIDLDFNEVLSAAYLQKQKMSVRLLNGRLAY